MDNLKNKKYRGLLLILAVVFLAVGGAVFFGYQNIKDSVAKIAVSPPDYDFGQIKNRDLIQSRDFEVKNIGDDLLKIQGVLTSCGCTKAAIDKLVLSPGETAKLNVNFDPQYHADAKGEIIREIYIESNDPAGETVIKIKAFLP